MTTIESSRPTGDLVTTSTPDASVRRFPPRRVRVALVAAAACAAVLAGIALQHRGSPVVTPTLDASSTPGVALRNAAFLVEKAPARDENGPIRHQRFRNLTDAGHPVYDAYVRPDGTAMVGPVAGPLEQSSGYLTSAQLASLPSDPRQLLVRMTDLAKELDLGFPGERPERAVYRLATELLPDAGLSPEVEAAVYEVVSGFDLTAIHATNRGVGTDAEGRTGLVLQFTFEEGVVDTLVLDRTTGHLLSTTSTMPDGSALGGQVYLETDTLASIPQPNA